MRVYPRCFRINDDLTEYQITIKNNEAGVLLFRIRRAEHKVLSFRPKKGVVQPGEAKVISLTLLTKEFRRTKLLVKLVLCHAEDLIFTTTSNTAKDTAIQFDQAWTRGLARNPHGEYKKVIDILGALYDPNVDKSPNKLLHSASSQFYNSTDSFYPHDDNDIDGHFLASNSGVFSEFSLNTGVYSHISHASSAPYNHSTISPLKDLLHSQTASTSAPRTFRGAKERLSLDSMLSDIAISSESKVPDGKHQQNAHSVDLHATLMLADRLHLQQQQQQDKQDDGHQEPLPSLRIITDLQKMIAHQADLTEDYSTFFGSPDHATGLSSPSTTQRQAMAKDDKVRNSDALFDEDGGDRHGNEHDVRYNDKLPTAQAHQQSARGYHTDDAPNDNDSGKSSRHKSTRSSSSSAPMPVDTLKHASVAELDHLERLLAPPSYHLPPTTPKGDGGSVQGSGKEGDKREEEDAWIQLLEAHEERSGVSAETIRLAAAVSRLRPLTTPSDPKRPNTMTETSTDTGSHTRRHVTSADLWSLDVSGTGFAHTDEDGEDDEDALEDTVREDVDDAALRAVLEVRLSQWYLQRPETQNNSSAINDRNEEAEEEDEVEGEDRNRDPHHKRTLQPKKLVQLQIRHANIAAIQTSLALVFHPLQTQLQQQLRGATVSTTQDIPLPFHRHLRSLSCQHSRLLVLDNSLNLFAQLLELDLSHNRLNSLGAGRSGTNSATNYTNSQGSGSMLSAALLHLPLLQTLNLAHNRLASLDGLQSISRRLHTLIAHDNRLASPVSSSVISVLLPLRASLRVLDVSHNPICREARYVEETLLAFPRLQLFDTVDLSHARGSSNQNSNNNHSNSSKSQAYGGNHVYNSSYAQQYDVNQLQQQELGPSTPRTGSADRSNPLKGGSKPPVPRQRPLSAQRGTAGSGRARGGSRLEVPLLPCQLPRHPAHHSSVADYYKHFAQQLTRTLQSASFRRAQQQQQQQLEQQEKPTSPTQPLSRSQSAPSRRTPARTPSKSRHTPSNTRYDNDEDDNGNYDQGNFDSVDYEDSSTHDARNSRNVPFNSHNESYNSKSGGFHSHSHNPRTQATYTSHDYAHGVDAEESEEVSAMRPRVLEGSYLHPEKKQYHHHSNNQHNNQQYHNPPATTPSYTPSHTPSHAVRSAMPIHTPASTAPAHTATSNTSFQPTTSNTPVHTPSSRPFQPPVQPQPQGQTPVASDAHLRLFHQGTQASLQRRASQLGSLISHWTAHAHEATHADLQQQRQQQYAATSAPTTPTSASAAGSGLKKTRSRVRNSILELDTSSSLNNVNSSVNTSALSEAPRQKARMCGKRQAETQYVAQWIELVEEEGGMGDEAAGEFDRRSGYLSDPETSRRLNSSAFSSITPDGRLRRHKGVLQLDEEIFEQMQEDAKYSVWQPRYKVHRPLYGTSKPFKDRPHFSPHYRGPSPEEVARRRRRKARSLSPSASRNPVAPEDNGYFPNSRVKKPPLYDWFVNRLRDGFEKVPLRGTFTRASKGLPSEWYDTMDYEDVSTIQRQGYFDETIGSLQRQTYRDPVQVHQPPVDESLLRTRTENEEEDEVVAPYCPSPYQPSGAGSASGGTAFSFENYAASNSNAINSANSVTSGGTMNASTSGRASLRLDQLFPTAIASPSTTPVSKTHLKQRTLSLLSLGTAATTSSSPIRRASGTFSVLSDGASVLNNSVNQSQFDANSVVSNTSVIQLPRTASFSGSAASNGVVQVVANAGRSAQEVAVIHRSGSVLLSPQKHGRRGSVGPHVSRLHQPPIQLQPSPQTLPQHLRTSNASPVQTRSRRGSEGSSASTIASSTGQMMWSPQQQQQQQQQVPYYHSEMKLNPRSASFGGERQSNTSSPSRDYAQDIARALQQPSSSALTNTDPTTTVNSSGGVLSAAVDTTITNTANRNSVNSQGSVNVNPGSSLRQSALAALFASSSSTSSMEDDHKATRDEADAEDEEKEKVEQREVPQTNLPFHTNANTTPISTVSTGRNHEIRNEEPPAKPTSNASTTSAAKPGASQGNVDEAMAQYLDWLQQQTQPQAHLHVSSSSSSDNSVENIGRDAEQEEEEEEEEKEGKFRRRDTTSYI